MNIRGCGVFNVQFQEVKSKSLSSDRNGVMKPWNEIYLNFSMIWRKIKSLIPFVTTDRTPFSLGMTSCEVNEFENRLIRNGYQYNYFSFHEKGQVTNMRKLFIVNEVDKKVIRQYHVRLFKDGEVRAHEEYAYEESMFKHVNGITIQPLPECELETIYKYIINRFPKEMVTIDSKKSLLK